MYLTSFGVIAGSFGVTSESASVISFFDDTSRLLWVII